MHDTARLLATALSISKIGEVSTGGLSHSPSDLRAFHPNELASPMNEPFGSINHGRYMSTMAPERMTQMSYEIFKTLLDQAERDFRVEATEIELIACPSQRLQEQTGEPDGAGQHPADLASEIVEREIAVGILAETNEMLAEILAARGRLSAGTFGRCESCGQNIDVERLRAVPWARRCASDERTRQAESRGYAVHTDPSAWLSDESWPEDAMQAGTWDPEDDHPIVSIEESAVHEMAYTSQS